MQLLTATISGQPQHYSKRRKIDHFHLLITIITVLQIMVAGPRARYHASLLASLASDAESAMATCNEYAVLMQSRSVHLDWQLHTVFYQERFIMFRPRLICQGVVMAQDLYRSQQ